jgi:hypothetical protein
MSSTTGEPKKWQDLDAPLHDLVRYADIADHFAIEICDVSRRDGDNSIVPTRMLELLILSVSVVQRECVAAQALYAEAHETYRKRKGGDV